MPGECSRNTLSDWRIATALRIAEARFQDHGVNIRAIARECRTSARYLGRLFRKHVGMSFHQHLFELRMRAAGAMLKASPRPVKEVASLVGYRDISNFVKDFRRYHEITPRRYSLSDGDGEH
jgi:transcriptional regulator GlxA family with amidase domain